VPDTQSTRSICEKAIRTFLDKTKITFPNFVRDPELEARVKAIIRSWGNEESLRPYVVTALILTVTAYSHISSMDTKVQITIFTTFIIAMDDPAVFNSLESREFSQRMCTGSLQNDPGMLGEFAKVLRGMWAHYTGFSANTIYASALRFVNASMLEGDSVTTALSSHALPFIEYKRSMSATTEAYACFIWEKTKFPDFKAYMQAIPDVMLYISYVNDILSFYKEELAGETANYIHERAFVTGKSVPDTLYDVIDDTVAALERARDILGEGQARAAFENFAAGYIRVHTGNPRYRLQDIVGGEYIIDVATY